MAEVLKDTIENNKVVIFSKSYCPYCTKVKALFKSLSVPVTVLELDERDDGAGIQDAILKQFGARTVPQVFVGGERIGGNDDTQALHQRGGLVPKLKAAAAL